MALLEVCGLARSFYGVHALNGVDLDVDAGRITGLRVRPAGLLPARLPRAPMTGDYPESVAKPA